MNDLMRPALYGANHKTFPTKRKKAMSKKTYEFVGPICESTNAFAVTKFQELDEKEFLLFVMLVHMECH